MKNLTAQAVYNADIYLRLSDDDGDKPESNSIKNQREFITEFLKSTPLNPSSFLSAWMRISGIDFKNSVINSR